MNYQKSVLWGIVLSTITWTCNSTNQNIPDSEELKLVIENPSSFERKDVLISLSGKELEDFISKNSGTSFSTPFQFNDWEGDGEIDDLTLLFNLSANEKKQVSLKELMTEEKPDFPKRTQAEVSHKINGEWKEREYLGGEFKNVQHLKVPEEHTDHSWYIRYEGPGWESDKVGYRFYLDWRNAIDIFGKKTPEMVLQKVGQDGFDSYHEPADWGMDILKVGSSLGLGSIAMWVDGKAERIAETDSLETQVLANGDLLSSIRTKYHGWAINDQKIHLTSDLSIQAGSRLTKHHLKSDQNLDNLCTGIVKLEGSELITKAQKGVSGWAYLATYGRQSLASDQLGMAIFFRNSDLLELTEDEHSHVLVLTPKHKELDYYFMAAWEQEPNGISSKVEFLEFLDKKLLELNNPVLVSLNGQELNRQ